MKSKDALPLILTFFCFAAVPILGLLLTGDLRIGWIPLLFVLVMIAPAVYCGRRLANRLTEPLSELNTTIEKLGRDCAGLIDANATLQASEAALRGENDRLRAEEAELRKAHAARERELERLAYCDVTTGLPNAAGFMRLLRERSAEGGVIRIRLENLQSVNEIMGWSACERLLCDCAARVTESRVFDATAACDGDGLLVYIAGSRREAEDYCGWLAELFARSTELEGAAVRVHASIGAAMLTDGAEAAVQNAGLAASRANELGKFCFFDDTLRGRTRRQAQILEILRESMLRNEVFLVYQPEFSLQTGGKPAAMEALLRLKNKHLGYISPVEFVPIAEANGLMLAMGYWVVEQACGFLTRLPGYTGRIAVNISAIQLFDDGFVDKIEGIIARAGVEPSRLQLEIKELMAANVELPKLSRLRGLGVGIALDNFGTAYSSLNQMAILPIDTVKIDRSFVGAIGIDDRGETIIRAIIEMAHQLGVAAVAEGVESEEQRTFLRENHCDLGQGYVFSAPLEEAAVMELVEPPAILRGI